MYNIIVYSSKILRSILRSYVLQSYIPLPFLRRISLLTTLSLLFVIFNILKGCWDILSTLLIMVFKLIGLVHLI